MTCDVFDEDQYLRDKINIALLKNYNCINMESMVKHQTLLINSYSYA